MADHDLARLATYVSKRRTELKLGVEPAAKLAGISKDTWKRVEAGQKVWDSKYAGVEEALSWAPGSCQDVMAGGEPLISTVSEADQRTRITAIPKAELERVFGDAVTSAAIATRGDLSGAEVRELNRRVMEELRQRGVL
ncbi:hypothetical protein [Streptomyces sp. NPDC056682]|uniref:hypothetical protein n=1 Tax=Streptomyces sp. NPDC056682 TaxID=3345909 RepID=UPI0036ADB426